MAARYTLSDILQRVFDPDSNVINTNASGSGGAANADGDNFTAGTSEGTGAMGVYESSPTTVTDNDMALVGIDNKRNQRMVGNVAAGDTDAGNPVKTGGKYNATPPTLTDGQRGDMQLDAAGNTKTSLGTLIAGEDLTNDVLKTEVRGSYSYQASAGDNKVIKASAGFLYGVIIGKDVASSIIEISDHASDGDGAVKIHLEGSTLMTSTKGYVPVNASFATGICADLDNQTHVTFIYR